MIFNAAPAGLTPAEWAEKSIKVEAKEKNAGYIEGAKDALITGVPQKATVVTILAESNEEAAKAVRAAYGQGIANGKFLVGKSSGLAETVAIP